MTFDEGLAVATLWQESRGSTAAEQLAVAHVVRNRMTMKYTSDGTVAGTVLVPWQFSGWMNDAITRESLEYVTTDILNFLSVWQHSVDLPDPTDGAVLYYSPGAMKPPGSAPSWVTSSQLTVEMPEFLFYRASNLKRV